MSIYINNLDVIAEHFDTTPAHVMDIYTQAIAYSNNVWTTYGIISAICIFAIGIICGYLCYKYSYLHDSGDFAMGFFMASFVSFVVLLIIAIIVVVYINSSVTMIEYKTYLDWINWYVGV